MESPEHRELERAADWIREADGLVVTAGAGMGVDSGLPDFRGEQGFWRAYPALGRAGIAFTSIASPRAFHANPRLAWGFYGHRLVLYRRTIPHAGFALLKTWGDRMPQGCGIFTSNVDGQFQKAGFGAERIDECHGSIHHLQCLKPCCDAIWEAEGFDPDVDEEACLLRSDLPLCPRCGGLARPNILMFGDGGWVESREAHQARALEAWLGEVQRPVVIELGAGTAIPTVRYFGEHLVRSRAHLIRINPDEAEVAPRHVGLRLGALEGLQAIDSLLR